MTVIENKKIYKDRSIWMVLNWLLLVSNTVWLCLYQNDYTYVWILGILAVLYLVKRWRDSDKSATEGVSSIRVGEAALTVEYIGQPVFKVHKDLIHSIKGYKRQAHIYYYRNEELCLCSLPKKYFDPESWKQVQKLQEML